MSDDTKKQLLELCDDAQVEAEQRLFREIKEERNASHRVELLCTLDAMNRGFTALRAAVGRVEKF